MEQYRGYDNQLNPNKKNNSSLNWGKLLVVLICLGVAGIGALLILVGIKQNEEAKEKAEYYVEVEATISDIVRDRTGDDTNYFVFIEYEYDNKIFGGELNYYTSAMNVGDTVEIMCDPNNPMEFISKSFFGKIGGILCIIGGIFIGVSLFIMIICLVATRKKKNVSMYGDNYNRTTTYYNGQKKDNYNDYWNDEQNG